MFDRFDDIQVPDQWDEIEGRAAGPRGPEFQDGGGPRIALLVAAAAAIVGLAGVLWVGLSDGDDLATVNTPADTVPATTTPATQASPTTISPTTVELTQPPVTRSLPEMVAATSPAISAPATTTPTDSTFECTEIAGDPSAVYEDDPALETFGPLGAAPALDITTGSSDILRDGVDVIRVNGGTAIVVQTRFDQEPGWSLTVVNDDGTTRWRRCGFEHEMYNVFAAARFLVLFEIDSRADTYTASPTQRLLDLSSGADAGTVELSSERHAYASEPNRYRLFGVPQPHTERGEPQPGAADAMLRVLDTEDMTTTQVPYPSGFYTGEQYADWIELVAAANSATGWILKQFSDQYPIVASVFVDGAWSSDPAVIRSVVPVAAFSEYGMGSPWNGLDPLGEILWTVPDKVAFWSEGPWHFQDAGIDLLVSCDRYDHTADGGAVCVSPTLLGVDVESGTLLWQLPGHRQVAAIGDGFAIITDDAGNLDDGTPPATWFMIDITTGEPVDGQSWTYETFEMNYYSMEDDGRWARRDGGVVLAVNGEHVRVWFPAGLSRETINVSLAT